MKSILTVTTAASSYDLTTLATVKAEFDITDNSQNAQLSTWIKQASSIASSYCRRVFALETLSETFRPARVGYPGVHANRRDALLLSRRPITSIISVTVDDVLVAASEYEFDADAGLLYRLDSSGVRWHWFASKSIIVAYVAGYELLGTLPQDVERAVIMIVRDMRSDGARDPNVIERDIPGVLRERWWASGEAKTVMPIEITGLLDPYKNLWMG